MKMMRILSMLLAAVLLFALWPPTPARAADGVWDGGAAQPVGEGTTLNPYRIGNGWELKWFADQVNSGNTDICAVLIDDIPLNDTRNWEDWANDPPANSWTPIGDNANKFGGIFDGQGWTISGVYINGTASYQGLFGYVGYDGKGEVKNVKLASSYIKGQNYVGGISGYMNFFITISGCESGATVVGTGSYTGGITSFVITNAKLNDCRNTGSVTGGIGAGGIAGANNGRVAGCVNLGTVSASGSYLGGLLGINNSELSDSYHAGSVHAGADCYFAGGICGANGEGGRITNAYSAGLVTNGWPVCTNTVANSSLANVYFLGDPSSIGISQNLGAGTPVGKSAAQFALGEVAYLMRAAYGQTFGPGGDALPVFRAANGSNAVYRLTYLNGADEFAAQYYNANNTVSSAGIVPPDTADSVFSEWAGLPATMPAEDVTIAAVFTPAFFAPQITTVSLPPGKTYQAYDARIEATGTAPVAYSVISGALPAGLTLDAGTGEIAGTPTAAGESTPTIQAQNAHGTDERAFSIQIVEGLPGDGSIDHPYEIWTASQLKLFAETVGGLNPIVRTYAVLKDDIQLNDMGDLANWGTTPPANEWTPIGATPTKFFLGEFEGNGHIISGLYCDSTGDYAGLFGYVSTASVIQNVQLTGSYIKGRNYVGGICGFTPGSLTNCTLEATVIGENYVGGICGATTAATVISGCQNAGTVTGNERVGGIAGYSLGEISHCSNTGTVQGSGTLRQVIGGISGYSMGALTNCYNTGTVSGKLNVGGICGIGTGTPAKNGTVTSAYSAGTITGEQNGGAICGSTTGRSTLSGCYFLDASGLAGIGYHLGGGSADGKSQAQFGAGEVAYLLGGAFGQTLGVDAYPVFRSVSGINAVYRLAYMSEGNQHAAQYYNEGNAVSAAGISNPAKGGHYFSHWEGLPGAMPASDASASAVFLPLGSPSQPQGLSATPGDGQVVLRWTAPLHTGGSAIIKYEVSMDGGGTWADAGGSTEHTFSGLTNGRSYHFQVRAVNGGGPGAAAAITAAPQATASPDYMLRDLADGATGISVSGTIHQDAAITVGEMTLHTGGTCAACDAIRQRMNDGGSSLFLLGKDISISHGFIGALTIAIPVDAQYNGRTATILHCAGGGLQTYTATVTNGKAVFSVTSLSPLALFAGVSTAPGPPVGAILPTVVTTSVTDVSATGATLKGSVIADGGRAVTERGFVYGVGENPAIGGAGVIRVMTGSGRGSFLAVLTGLDWGAVYYVRAYAINGAGIAYGAALQFRTDVEDLDDIPKTGDSGVPLIWGLLCGAFAAGIVTLLILDKRKKTRRRGLRAGLLLAFAAVFAGSAVILILYAVQGEREESALKKLASIVAESPKASAPALIAAAEPEAPTDSLAKPSEPAMLAQYRELYERNGDMVGWVKIEGTGIDYPVMHTSDDFYLSHGFDKEESKSGLPFIDKRCAVEPFGTNTILYGHHMKNGAMFASLENFQEEAYYKEHPAICFDTLYERREYKIIAVLKSRIYKKNDAVFKHYNFLNAESKADFDAYIENIKALSLYDTGVTASYGDALLTLVTCSYHEENGQFVVVAKRV